MNIFIRIFIVATLALSAHTLRAQILFDRSKDGMRMVSTRSAILTQEGKSPLVYVGYSVQIQGKKRAYFITLGVKSTQPIAKVNEGDRLLMKIGEKEVLKFEAMPGSMFSKKGNIYYSNSTYRVQPSQLEQIARAQRVRIGMADHTLDVDVDGHAYMLASAQLSALNERLSHR